MTKVIIPMGPYHPAMEEQECVRLTVEGEKVVDAEISIGYNLRGIEKLAMERTYEQVIVLVERICGICSDTHPTCFVQATESISEIEIPDRARYIRTIVLEIERIHSHMLWFGLAGHLIGYDTLFMYTWKQREIVMDLLEMISGNRVNYAINTIGGVRRDITPEMPPKILKGMETIKDAVKKIIKAVEEDPTVKSRLKGIGILPKEEALEQCAVGPTARASGVNIDVRRDDPYAAYNEIPFDVITQTEGDAYAKAVVRLLEILESTKIVKCALDALPQGEIKAEVKHVPPGQAIGRVEAPRGDIPERLKIRAPTYMNIPTIKPMIIGENLADAPLIIASIDPCWSCTDRVMIINRKDKKSRFLRGDEFNELSRRSKK
jgi:NADH-quinone oxidoreductase subunit D